MKKIKENNMVQFSLKEREHDLQVFKDKLNWFVPTVSRRALTIAEAGIYGVTLHVLDHVIMENKYRDEMSVRDRLTFTLSIDSGRADLGVPEEHYSLSPSMKDSYGGCKCNVYTPLRDEIPSCEPVREPVVVAHYAPCGWHILTTKDAKTVCGVLIDTYLRYYSDTMSEKYIGD